MLAVLVLSLAACRSGADCQGSRVSEEDVAEWYFDPPRPGDASSKPSRTFPELSFAHPRMQRYVEPLILPSDSFGCSEFGTEILSSEDEVTEFFRRIESLREATGVPVTPKFLELKQALSGDVDFSRKWVVVLRHYRGPKDISIRVSSIIERTLVIVDEITERERRGQGSYSVDASCFVLLLDKAWIVRVRYFKNPWTVEELMTGPYEAFPLKLRRRSLLMDGSVNADLGLVDLDGLFKLSLAHTEVVDLTPLSGHSTLQILELTDTMVSDLEPLAEVTPLRTLLLKGTSVVDLKPLAGLSNLEVLDLRDTKAIDLKPLAGLKKLRDLSVSTYVPADDIEWLRAQLPSCLIH